MMKKYPAYKDSGFDWLKEVPEHWETTKAKWLFANISEKNRPDEQLLSATQEFGVVPRDMLEERVVMPMGELVHFKLVQQGDFVISLRSFQGGVEYSDYRGLVSPAYTVLRNKRPIDKTYFKYLMKCFPFISELQTSITGIREGKNINYKHFAEIIIPMPPISEQNKIAQYIEEQTAVINQFLTNKRRLIGLLEEQKQVVINTAVTQGLNPNAPRKPSGIEWLGDIPAHWEEKRCKYFFREVNERSTTGAEELLSVSHITGVTPRSEKEITMFQAESYEGYKTCQADDLVINIMWAWMGAMGVSQYYGIISSAYGVYREQKAKVFHSPYLDHLVRIKQYIAEYTCRSTGIRSSRLRMYTDDFFDMPIICPPYNEQVAIIEYIQQKTAEINATIARIQREIELIEEYRTTLIANVVTGKIDVRSTV